MSRHIFHCPLRWSDMDAFGHVNNVTFLTYLEQARIDLIYAAGLGEPIMSSGVVVARHEIDYRAPLRYRPEPVQVQTWVSRIGNASFTVGYQVRDADTLYVEAATVLVPYDAAEGRPRRVSPAEKELLGRFLEVGRAA